MSLEDGRTQLYRQSSALSSDILFHIISAECREEEKYHYGHGHAASLGFRSVRMFGPMTMIECGTYLAVEIGWSLRPALHDYDTDRANRNVSQSVEEASYVCEPVSGKHF